MNKRVLLVLTTLLLAGGLLGGFALPVAARETKILEFNVMVGVPRPYTGNANPIRGIDGGGLPWVIGPTHGLLKSNGMLEMQVRGLVLDPNDPAVIERGLGGTNPIPEFMAIVSCLSKDAAGNAVTVNVSAGPFKADSGGRSKIKAMVNLPSPCIAPIVFVTSPTGAWFAATGY